MAGKHYKEALRMDPDHVQSVRAIKRMKTFDSLKEEANKFYKEGNNEEAIKKYTECIQLDKYNANFNSIVYCNRALAKFRLKEFKNALDDLDKSILLNDQYAKVTKLYNLCHKYSRRF